jgi:hypothetical protein
MQLNRSVPSLVHKRFHNGKSFLSDQSVPEMLERRQQELAPGHALLQVS